MTVSNTDVAIVGGGLSGGLIALELTRRLPQLDTRLIEGGNDLGGNHRWSWFATDLRSAESSLLDEFLHTQWQSGYGVRFPEYERKLRSSYRSLASKDFAATLHARLNQGSVRTGEEVVDIARGRVELASGEAIAARAVIDCRGLSQAPELNGGWQVFLGQTWRCDKPHGQREPIIMDARVEQLGGYRFVYVLPLDDTRIFVEDTYYQDEPNLDVSLLRARLNEYVATHGWGGMVEDEETGMLPVITGGDFAAFQNAHRIPGIAIAGARGGFVHPLTSYTLPFAARTASLVANIALEGKLETIPERLEREARQHWRDTAFYRLLGQMLFGAADPGERYRIFQRFYRLRQPLIERFYAGRSTFADKGRILAGRPPVPIFKAIGALASRRPPLSAGNHVPPPGPHSERKAA